jgi:DNA-binding SARP family transcriptional activator
MATLHAGLPPPVVPRTTLARADLERRLDEAFGARLTTVVAGSGFGKTTALAAWARDVSCAWSTLSPREAAFDALVHRLTDAVAAGTGATVPRSAALEGALGTTEQAEATAAALARTLQRRLEHDLVLVLDDVQEIETDTPAAWLLDAFWRQLPATAHLVLVSQRELPVRTERLRNRGELVEIDARTLGFTRAEVRELTTRVLAEDVADLAEAIYERTGGWPLAARLLLEQLRDTPADDRLRAVRALPEHLVDYLLDEVLAREPAETQELVRILAALEEASAELVEALGIPAAGPALDALARRGLFVSRHPAGPDRFSLHALVRDIAPELLGIDERALASLRREAARWHEERGEIAAALRLAVLATDSARAASLLSRHGFDLVRHGLATEVLQASECLPDSTLDPLVERTLGDAHAARGEWSEALMRYERASGRTPALPAGLAWRLGRIHFDRGLLDEALAAYSRGLDDESEPAERALLLAWTASCHWSLGERGAAAALAQQALVTAAETDEPRALAVAHNVLLLLALGEDAVATASFEAGLAAAERAGDASLVVRLRANRATQLAARGALRDALEVLAPALEAAELAGGGLQLAFPLMKRGEIFLGLGRLDDALTDFRAALAIYERFGSRRRFGAIVNLADAQLARGEVVLARLGLEQALHSAETSGDAQLELYASVSFARALAFDDPERALELARTASLAARRLGFGLELAWLAEGWVRLAAGGRGEAEARAEDARAEAERHRALPALADALVLSALAAPDPSAELATLEQAALIHRETGDVLSHAAVELLRARLDPGPDARAQAFAAERTLRAAGVRIASAAGIAGPLAFLPPESPPAVEVRTLGGLTLLRHGRPVPLAEWKSRQARELLKMLVARRCRPVPREQLMALLWPDERPERVAGRLAFVISTLRSVLDPNRPREAPPLVEARDDALRLRDDLVAVDVETFLRDAERALASEGRERVALLETAESAYTGDFLEEDPYADWAVSLREQARATYIALARTLAEASISADEPMAATRYLLRILERDRYDEHAHVRLVVCLQAAGAYGEARRAYRRYVGAMADLGVEPAPYPEATRVDATR